jgi:hypothetical protein
VDGTAHGTNCAGIIGGYNDAAGTGTGQVSTTGYHFGTGVAPAVKLGASKLFAYDGTGVAFSPSAVEDHAYREGARISSNSWGYTSVLEYDDVSFIYDGLVRDASTAAGLQPMVVLFAASNEGPSPGTVSSPGTAKNVITLGAAENCWPGYSACGWSTAMTDSPGDDIVSYSGRGPVPDGRIKPDLAAIANGWVSTRGEDAGTGCGWPYDTADGLLYRNFNGTSAATPAAAGAAALVYQHALIQWGGPPSPAMVKAVLVASARDMAGGIDCNAGDGSGPAIEPIPNGSQGWGQVDTGRAFDGSPAYRLDQSVVFSGTGQSWSEVLAPADAMQPVRIALVWTDPPSGSYGAPWVNDLDLRVTTDGSTYYGNHLSGGVSATGGSPDTRNNVEVAILPSPGLGDIQIEVVAANIAGDGVPQNGDFTDQDFAVYAYNTTVEDCQPTFTGVREAGPSAGSECSIVLEWDAATTGCAGADLAYTVYRSTDPAFEPSLANQIAAGVSALGYVDAGATDPSQAYTYMVRATDRSTGVTETNTQRLSAMTGSCSSLGDGEPGEVAPNLELAVSRGSGSAVTLSFIPAANATDTCVYADRSASPLLGGIAWSESECGHGVGGATSFDPGVLAAGEMAYFVVVGEAGGQLGSFGRDSQGLERPRQLAAALQELMGSLRGQRPRPKEASWRDGQGATSVSGDGAGDETDAAAGWLIVPLEPCP